ncbi:hypothetical protein GCM10027275_14230 [Rhabdobacter roseus]|nr:hypothetical protein [Rhabdobacter roseus]
MSLDSRTKLPTLRTLEGQRVPPEFKIRCDRRAIADFPEGTIYKLDIRLIETRGKRPYFSALRSKKVPRALEFFEHNLLVQRGENPEKTKRKPAYLSKRKSNTPASQPREALGLIF